MLVAVIAPASHVTRAASSEATVGRQGVKAGVVAVTATPVTAVDPDGLVACGDCVGTGEHPTSAPAVQTAVTAPLSCWVRN